MLKLLDVLLGALGLGNGASVVNKGIGLVSNFALVPVIMYLLAHANEDVTFHASLGFLALLGAFIYVILEMARRSDPHGGGN